MRVTENLLKIKDSLPENVTLVAVSKFHPSKDIEQAYQAGQRIFGESRPQEMLQKYQSLPKDIEWHFIGHLQTNKIKMIVPFVSLIHSVDSLRLAQAISEAAIKEGRVVDVLLEVHVAKEQTKQGFTPEQVDEVVAQSLSSEYNGINIVGVMGMATFTDDMNQVESEFKKLAAIYHKHNFRVLSMGMSDDYPLAISCGSNMVRVGSSIFGNRN